MRIVHRQKFEGLNSKEHAALKDESNNVEPSRFSINNNVLRVPFASSPARHDNHMASSTENGTSAQVENGC